MNRSDTSPHRPYLVAASRLAAPSAILAAVVLCWSMWRFTTGDTVTMVLIAVSALSLGLLAPQATRLERFERESKVGPAPASFSSISVLAILLVIIWIGAILRFQGLSFGLPAHFHPDEVAKVNAVMRMVQQGDLNPRYFLHPSLLLYATYGCNVVIRALGAGGTFDESAYVAGRLVSAIAGTVSIGLVYCIARRMIRGEMALVAAAMLAFSPLHVTCSRYLKEDALLTMWILATALIVIIAVDRTRPRLLLLAAITAGCAAGTKYSGMLCMVLIASAPWVAAARERRVITWRADRRFLLPVFAALIVMIGAFLVTTPYSVLDSAKFLKDFSYEQRHMAKGHTSGVDPWSQLWMYHASRSLAAGMTLPALILSLVGCGIALRRFNALTWFILASALLFYLPSEYVLAKPAPQPERYVLPCVPFLAIAIGIGLDQLRSRGGRGVFAACWLIVYAVLVPAFTRSAALASEISTDTRVEMAEWIHANLEPGSRVLVDWNSYGPTIDEQRFRVEFIPRNNPLRSLDLTRLRRTGAKYFVVSSLFYGRFFGEPNFEYVHRAPFRELDKRLPLLHASVPRYGTYGFHNPTLKLYLLNADPAEGTPAAAPRTAGGPTASDDGAKGEAANPAEDAASELSD